MRFRAWLTNGRDRWWESYDTELPAWSGKHGSVSDEEEAREWIGRMAKMRSKQDGIALTVLDVEVEEDEAGDC